MGLIRLLFWIALIAAAFWLWRRFTRSRGTPPPPRAEPQPMVRCEYCHMHVPLKLAIKQDEHWYCSQVHLEQDRHDS